MMTVLLEFMYVVIWFFKLGICLERNALSTTRAINTVEAKI